MNKKQKLQLCNTTIIWLSKEVAEVSYIIERLKKTSHIKGYTVGQYSMDDIDILEYKLKELNCRSDFESRNIKRIRDEY
jgi:hypothetical protein